MITAGKKRGIVTMMRQQKTVVSYGRAYVMRQKNRRRRRKYRWLCLGIGLLFVLVYSARLRMKRSQSIAAMQPDAAAVMACR